MQTAECLRRDIDVARRELKNIRQEVLKQKSQLKCEVDRVEALLLQKLAIKKEEPLKTGECAEITPFPMTPIGFVSSSFTHKNGIPRQPSLGLSARATLEINKSCFTNPEHSLIGLDKFSFIWILFVFHKNGVEGPVKAKVHPPRLCGASMGVFSTRSPHRPCAIGLSLTRLDKIVGSTLFLSGIDMLDGTPVLDIKPYFPHYDSPHMFTKILTSSSMFPWSSEGVNDIDDELKMLSIDNEASMVALLKQPAHQLEVVFTQRATLNIMQFHGSNRHATCPYCLSFLKDSAEAALAITEILQNDPRSVYRREKCSDKLYYFEIDSMHVTSWFDENKAEVLKVRPGIKRALPPP